jgi:hypothetical protein
MLFSTSGLPVIRQESASTNRASPSHDTAVVLFFHYRQYFSGIVTVKASSAL